MRLHSGLLLCGSLIALTACDEPGEKVLGIEATGELRGSAFLDRDDDSRFTPPIDALFRGLRVSLVPRSGGPAVTATTDSLGQFRFAEVLVGSYRIEIDAASVGDTIRVARVDSAQFTLGAQDTLRPVITLAYSTTTLLAAKSLPVGSRVAIAAAALNSWPTFGDSTVHLVDFTASMRAVQVPPLAIDMGDQLRLLATVSRRDTEVTLRDITIITSRDAAPPAPETVSTARADTAGGHLDAAQVRIDSATVLDAVSLPGNDVLVTVNDQSGPLEVLIDSNAGIATALPISQGAELDVTGVLVPVDGNDRWRLKPRRSSDVTVRYPPIPVRTARSFPTGRFLSVHAIALNRANVFGDNTVHVADTTAAIRVFNRPALFSAGDSLNAQGTLRVIDGQPVIFDAIVSVLGRVAVPPPLTLTTLRAASADSGRVDAALVRVVDAVVDSTVVFGDGVHLRVNDGTGILEVVLDQDWAQSYPTPAKGTTLDIVGVLVPVATGRWVLKPREASDIVVK